MPRKRFMNEQIAFTLRQAENGATVDEVRRPQDHQAIRIQGKTLKPALPVTVMPYWLLWQSLRMRWHRLSRPSDA